MFDMCFTKKKKRRKKRNSLQFPIWATHPLQKNYTPYYPLLSYLTQTTI